MADRDVGRDVDLAYRVGPVGLDPVVRRQDRSPKSLRSKSENESFAQ